MGIVIATVASLAEKVALSLATKSIVDGVGKLRKKSPEEKVAKSLEKALDKVSPNNEFWKKDVKKQIGDVIRILIHTLDNPRYIDNNSLPNYLDKKTIEIFKDCLKEDPEAWDYIKKVHYEEILQDIRIDVWETKVDVQETKDIAIDNNQKLIDNGEALRRIEEKLNGGSTLPVLKAKHIKIFLASSIIELKDERIVLGDYIMNSIRPRFKNDNVEVELVKSEYMDLGYNDKPSQDVIDDEIKNCDISFFLFKHEANPITVHEFNVTRAIQKLKKSKHKIHPIFVYCLDIPNAKRGKSLLNFQKRLKEEEKLYWISYKNEDDLRDKINNNLQDFERHLLGKSAVKSTQYGSYIKNADQYFEEYLANENAKAELKKSQAMLQEKIHKDIDEMLKQPISIMKDEKDTIAGRIDRVIKLYQKVDLWGAATSLSKEKYSNILLDYAKFLYKYGIYNSSKDVYIRQISLVEDLYGTESLSAANSYNEIGVVYRKQGNYNKALEYHNKALTIYKKRLGTEHPDIATTFNNIGSVHWIQGNYDKALEYYLMALEIREKTLGTEHPDTATSYNDIGRIFGKQGNYEKALIYCLKALEIREKVFGIEHPTIASAYHHIGTIYYNQGDYAKALEYYIKALPIVEKTLGTEHPNTASAYYHLGLLYYKLSIYLKAIKYLKKALQIQKTKLGDNHPKTQTTRKLMNTITISMSKVK